MLGLWNGTTKVACKKLKGEGGLDNEINMLVYVTFTFDSNYQEN